MNPLIFIKKNALFVLGVFVVATLAVGGTQLQKVRDDRRMQKPAEEHALVSTTTQTVQPTDSTPVEAHSVTAPLPPRPSVQVRREDDD